MSQQAYLCMNPKWKILRSIAIRLNSSSQRRKAITNGEYMGKVLQIKLTEKLMFYILLV
jgi:hypothetical protein